MDRAMKSLGGKYSVPPAHDDLQYLSRVNNRTPRPEATRRAVSTSCCIRVRLAK